MVEERTGCDDFLAVRSDRSCARLLNNLVEDALHIAEVERSLGLGWGDGWCGLRKSSRGQQSDEHEFHFHGWSYL